VEKLARCCHYGPNIQIAPSLDSNEQFPKESGTIITRKININKKGEISIFYLPINMCQ
jgi:hypothetical protein